MAGDYIPFDHDLPRKEEVHQVIEATGASIEIVLYRLCLMWIMADRETIDGVLHGAGPRSFASIIGGKPSFWEAVAIAGWVIFENGNATIPNFHKRFGKSSKARRLESQERKRSWREAQKTRDKPGDKTRDKPGDTLGTSGPPVSVSVSVSESSVLDETRRDDHVSLSSKEESKFPISRDWAEVEVDVWRIARRIGKVVGVRPENRSADRSLILKAAFLSLTAMPEMWLSDALEAVKQGKHKRNKAAYLHECLDAGAKERNEKFSQLLALCEKEIPADALAGTGDYDVTRHARPAAEAAP